MRAIHDVSSGRLHTGVMKAFLRGSITANWPSWVNRGGGAERIHQTSPHLCEMSKEHHDGLLHLSGLKCFSAFSCTSRHRPDSSSQCYPHFIPLSWLPSCTRPPTPNLYLSICPRLCPHLRLLIHCPVSGSIEGSLWQGGHCMPRLHTNILLKSHPFIPPFPPPDLTLFLLGHSLYLWLNYD